MACWYQPLPGSFFVSGEVIIFLALRHSEISINNKSKNYRDKILVDHGFKGKYNTLYFIFSSRRTIFTRFQLLNRWKKMNRSPIMVRRNLSFRKYDVKKKTFIFRITTIFAIQFNISISG